MREIKFRAWNRETKKMQYFTLNTLLEGYGDDCSYTPEGEEPWVSPIWQPTMQYTGLQDKNGKEIYEGDVVEITSNMVLLLTGEPTGNITTTRYRVVYSSEDLIWYVIDNKGNKSRAKFYLQGGDVKIIGNIYENPELMGVAG